MNLVQMLEMNSRKFGDKDCLRYDGKSITHKELNDLAGKAAAGLQKQGLTKGDRVSIMSRNVPAFLISFYGTLKAGGTVVPINHKLTAPEVDYILEHSESKMLLFDGALKEVALKVASPVRKIAFDSKVDGVDFLDDVMNAAGDFKPVKISNQDVAEILYTSGTTGKPKGCVHTHATVGAAGITGAMTMKMDSKDRLLMAMPIWHSSPLNNWFMGIQYVGGTTVMIPEYHPLHFLNAVQQEKCTVYFGAPISYILPIQMLPNFNDFDLSSMRCWIYGGGPMSSDTARTVIKAYKSDNFYQVYGMTEAGPTGTTLFPDEQVSKAGSIGRRALPGADMRVVKLDGGDAGPGEVGEIWLQADSMMNGYLKNEKATEEAFSDNWYKTGDMAGLDEDGYLFIVDRIKDMIVTGGENVYSKEVEDAIMMNPQVLEAAVVGVPHPDWGETVVAMVVPKKDETITPEDLSRFLSDKLARYKIPKQFKIMEALPHTPSGKVMKFQLRDKLQDSK